LSGQKTRKLTGLAALGANQTDNFDRSGGRMFKKSSGTFFRGIVININC
jgi:hypothetical protein